MIESLERIAPGESKSVAGLLRDVAATLAPRFTVCAVRGELSGFSRAGSGHCYFNLKDADGEVGVVRCAMFRRSVFLLDFDPADGQRVELRGRLGVYEPRGELQFVVESMRRAGAGALFEQFTRLRLRLEAEGLFEAGRKRPLPAFPRCIGLVTSLGGAVLHDVAATLSRRAPHVRVVVYPSAVQGAAAASALRAAIESAARHGVADLLIVCRGGGSLEDLWSFNDEQLVRAIVASPLPVISGVGHETDFTLADFAADLRAPTPTAAAELAAPSTRACLDALELVRGRLQRLVRARLDTSAQRLDRLCARLMRPAQRVRQQSQQLDHFALRLDAALRRGGEQRRATLDLLGANLTRGVFLQGRRQTQRLQHLEARLRTLDPRHVLARGYAWLADSSARPVMSVRQLALGERLEAVLSDGSAGVVVERLGEPR